jgi:hypothetical protein
MTLVELSELPGEVSGRSFRRSFPGDHPFDQPQAVLDVLDQADEVRNHGAVGVILVVGRLCDAYCVLHGCAPQLFF